MDRTDPTNVLPILSYSLLFVFTFLLFLMRPIDDHDLFLWLRIGIEALEHGPFSAESVNYTLAGQPQHAHGWLWNIFIALQYKLGGLFLIKCVHALLFSVTLMLPLHLAFHGAFHGASLEHKRFFKEDTAALIDAWLIALFATLIFTSIRPYIISFFFFSLVYYLLWTRRWSLGLWFTVAAVVLTWQNMRMSSFLVLPLIVFRAIDLLSEDPEHRMRHLLFSVSLALTTLFIFLSIPLGLEIFEFAKYNLDVSREFYQIGEWYAIWEYGLSHFQGFWLALLLGVPMLLVHRSKMTLGEQLLALLFLGFALYSARFIPYWVIVSLPFFVRALSALISGGKIPTLGSLFMRSHPAMRQSLIILLLLLGVRQAFVGSVQLTPEFPMSCVKAASSTELGKRVYSPSLWSGLVAFYGYPEKQIAIDRRLYLFSKERLRENVKLLRGELDPNSFSADVFLVDTRESSKLIERLTSDMSWQRLLLESEEYCAVFSKRVEYSDIQK